MGHVLAHNHGMLALCAELGFSIADSAADPGVKRVALAL
jgi:hypothetical protein